MPDKRDIKELSTPFETELRVYYFAHWLITVFFCVSGAPAWRKSTALRGPTSLSSHSIFHAISSHCASPLSSLLITLSRESRTCVLCEISRNKCHGSVENASVCTISIIHKNTNFLWIRRERLVYFFDLIRVNIILIASMKATGIVNRRKYYSAETVVAL